VYRSKRTLVYVLGVLLVLPLILTAGCGTTRSPSAVVTQFYLLASKGEYEAASKYLSADARMMFGLFVGVAEGMKQFASEELGSHVVRRVEILGERISGNQAEVRYILHYRDGTIGPEDSDVLVKEKGQGKIGLNW